MCTILYIHTHVCTHVCMYVRTNVCMYVCTVQITHNLNDPRVSHACRTRVTRTLQRQKHAWHSRMRVHACSIQNTRVACNTRVYS